MSNGNAIKYLLTALVVTGARVLSSNNTIKWSTIKKWIDERSNPDDLNRGYAGGQLSSQPQRIFAEIRRGKSSGKVQVTAAIVFNPSQGPAYNQSWTGGKLDSDLLKRFGDGNSFRITL